MLHRSLYDAPMPTTNPRISVTLTPAVSAVLKELSALSGNSQSSMVAELLETSVPIFEKVCTVLRAAATVQESAKTQFRENLERAHDALEAQMGLELGRMDDVSRPLLEAAEKVHRRGGGRARTGGRSSPPTGPAPAEKTVAKTASRTPVSNRGVTPTPPQRPTAKKSARRRSE